MNATVSIFNLCKVRMTFIRRPTTRLLKEAKHLVAKLKNWHFVLCHLDLGPMTLILKLDLDMVKINHHKVYVLITSKVIAQTSDGSRISRRGAWTPEGVTF